MPCADDTRWSVVRAAASGDAAAREQFAGTYLAVVRAYFAARWKEGPFAALIDDAVQDVFVDCFRDGGALGRLDRARTESFRTFLYGVARKVALRHEERAAQRAGVRAAPAEVDLAEAAREASLSRAFDRAWAQALLERAVERLVRSASESGEPAQRRVALLRLRFGEDLPIRDIARRWQIDAAKLHHEYAAARAEFKRALLAEIGEYRGGSPAEIEAECAALLALVD